MPYKARLPLLNDLLDDICQLCEDLGDQGVGPELIRNVYSPDGDPPTIHGQSGLGIEMYKCARHYKTKIVPHYFL